MMRVSIIIPSYNEVRGIRDVVEAVRQQDPYEIIVSDGESTDGTQQVLMSLRGLRVIASMRGRAAQMNSGAKAATGDVLLFLHADTFLPDGGLNRIQSAMEDSCLAGGRFRASFDDSALKFKILACYTRFSFFSYGDQGFFVRKKVFDEMRGFDERTVFEDVDFFCRLKARGRVVILKQSVKTSARRFREVGFFKQKMINIFLTGLFFLGICPKRILKHFYPDTR